MKMVVYANRRGDVSIRNVCQRYQITLKNEQEDHWMQIERKSNRNSDKGIRVPAPATERTNNVTFFQQKVPCCDLGCEIEFQTKCKAADYENWLNCKKRMHNSSRKQFYAVYSHNSQRPCLCVLACANTKLSRSREWHMLAPLCICLFAVRMSWILSFISNILH